MYDFTVVLLLGLAALALTDVLVNLVPKLAGAKTLLRFVVGVAAVVVIDYSLFAGFDITLRETWMGTWATGVIVGSLATVWGAVLGFLGSHEHTALEPTKETRPRIAA